MPTLEEVIAERAELAAKQAELSAQLKALKLEQKDALAQAKREYNESLAGKSFEEVVAAVATTPATYAKNGNGVWHNHYGVEVTIAGIAYTVNLSVKNNVASSAYKAQFDAAKANASV